jgi:TatD DNase family protein
MKLYDAHNHLQDERFGGRQAELLAACAEAGVARMVVNGACEGDWPQVTALAREYPQVIIASFGYHPWYVQERTPDWQKNLTQFLDAIPGAVGEIGLDRWKPDLPYAGQEEIFVWQLRLAAERNLPVSIHCLQAWGRLFDLLREHPRPQRGFVLHSFGGPQEMVPALAKLGAYFSFPGYFLHERKVRQREAFKRVPPDRLLVETDAPDQPLPAVAAAGTGSEKLRAAPARYSLSDPATGKPINHPANLAAVYHGLAGILNEDLERLAGRVEENFLRLFGGL